MPSPPNINPRIRWIIAIAVLSFAGTACTGKSTGDTRVARSPSSEGAQRALVACVLMPKETISAITGELFTKATPNDDDGHSTSSDCQYTSPTNQTGIHLSLAWIDPHDYTNPVEHAALQKAMIGGAKLGGSLVGKTLGGASLPGIINGPVDSLGDEATLSMLLLTARKNDVTVQVQIFPQDMVHLLTDSTFATAIVTKEKQIVRQTLANIK